MQKQGNKIAAGLVTPPRVAMALLVLAILAVAFLDRGPGTGAGESAGPRSGRRGLGRGGRRMLIPVWGSAA